MTQDESKLVREITQSLYSSLEIEKSLHETLLLLKEYLPLDLVHVFILDTSAHTLRYLAEATVKRGTLIDEGIQLSYEHFNEVRDQAHGDVRVLQSSESPMLKSIHAHFLRHVEKPIYTKKNEFSVMTMGFDIVPPLVGGFGLVTGGGTPYDTHHLAWMKLIRRPLIGAVLNLLHHRDLVCENERLSTEKKQLEHRLGHDPTGRMIGVDSGLKEVNAMVNQVAALDSPVLILGETGTGKELVANAVHQSSRRCHGPMIRVNCGAIAEGLLDSELFGHEKGAFTGATRLKRGYFEQADGGTIFLDEIGELPPAAQVKLLRVLQTLEFNRVGGSWPVSVDVRVVVATNRDLFAMVREKRFREDLWFRLNVFPIRIPPLRDRRQDIAALTRYFVDQKSREMNRDPSPEVKDSEISQLMAYDWPGNIRELQNVIERALILSRGRGLSFENLMWNPDRTPENRLVSPPRADFSSMDEVVKGHIQEALKRSGCKIEGPGGAAELLAMHPSTLRSRMKKFGIGVRKSSGQLSVNSEQ
ncbi:sigma-54 dependent transcriptional regulator [Desulfoluna sp.]|uniref:sigma-54 interaction domain-containing protein n=1 Tax=Desulfoluna sp. TaxID=2045199 RepID=UPI00262B3FFF|nr:sigma-54 dependent transcriptional regulator [Desulfoluna sp.]